METDEFGNIKIPLLEVFLMQDKDTGQKVFGWTFKNNPNAYTMVGILETIQADLIEKIKKEGFGDNNYG